MPRRTLPSIPFELHQKKAQQIYEKRKAERIDGSPESDREQGEIKFNKHLWSVRALEIKKVFAESLQPSKSSAMRLWRSFKALINGIWNIIAFPFWLPFQLKTLFDDESTRPFALDVVKTIATFAAAIGLFITYQNASLDRQLTQERLITDRFTKAVEQIGNSKEEVVIGGIYSLERIAKDSPKDQWTIMEVLTAFVRNNALIPSEIKEIENKEEQKKALEELKPVSFSVQAALTVIGRRNSERDNTQENREIKSLNLSESNLSQANLRSTNLRSANLRSANLNRTNLVGADLFDANLKSANLRSANLRSANLSQAKLRNANLFGANLSLVNLSNTTIKLACSWKQAIYTDSYWSQKETRWVALNTTANQQKIKEIRQDKASDPKTPPDCQLFEDNDPPPN